MESGVLDDTWDDKASNRMSTIRFMEDDDDEDDEEVRTKGLGLMYSIEKKCKSDTYQVLKLIYR